MSERFLRIKQVCSLLGYSRTTLYTAIKAGRFVQPRQLGPRAVGFLESEVNEWIRSRPVADPSIHNIGIVSKRSKAARDAQFAEEKVPCALSDAGLKRPLEAYRDFRMQENF
jgi:prophage regulatory protein